MSRPATETDPEYAATADGLYAGRSNQQRADLLTRLRGRQLTARKLALYAIAVVLLFSAQPAPITFALGSIILALGLALRIWTFGHLEKNQEMITTGPFAHTRNPAYLGSALVLAGLALAAGNAETAAGVAPWAFGVIGIGLFFTIYLPRKYRREYKRLSKLFRHDFERHARHVPHFIPRMTPWQSGSERRFSWALVQLNHEVIWPLTCLLALCLMWFY